MLQEMYLAEHPLSQALKHQGSGSETAAFTVVVIVNKGVFCLSVCMYVRVCMDGLVGLSLPLDGNPTHPLVELR